MHVSPKPERAAVAAHVSALAVAVAAGAAAGGPAIWIGMVTFLGPLATFVVVGRRDAFVRAHAVAALRFNLSVAVYLAFIVAGVRLTSGSPYTVQFLPFFLFSNMLVAANWLLFSIVAMHRAGTGQLFTYPMTLSAVSRLRPWHRREPGPSAGPPTTTTGRSF
jgi:uncharacterized Tic20 family protein